jgi:diguanylate cyclase (GGDEF)-like protein
MNNEPQPSPDLYEELEALSARDWQLWSICALLIVVFAIGFAAFALPNLSSVSVRTDHQYLPQLFFGLIALIILFNIYILDQKRTLNRTRAQMLKQLVRSSQEKEVALIDPLTGVFNRRYMEEVVPRETSKALRSGTEVSFLMIDVDGFRDINTKFGHFGGDQYLRDLATLLKKTFRGSDTVLRVGGDEFLVILPETSEKQAQRAAERLQWETKWWNQAGHAKYEISLSCGVATFHEGMDTKQVLDLADREMYRAKAGKNFESSSKAGAGEKIADKIEASDAAN